MRRIHFASLSAVIFLFNSFSEFASASSRLPLCAKEVVLFAQCQREAAAAAQSEVLKVGLNLVTVGAEYKFGFGMAPTRLNVEEALSSKPFVAESKFRNSLLDGNNPHHEGVANGYVQNGHPVIAISIGGNSVEQRAGIFKVVEGDWKDAPEGWKMVDSVMKSFTVGTLKRTAVPISGLRARWGAFLNGNNPEFDFKTSVKTSSYLRYFYLWVKYDS